MFTLVNTYRFTPMADPNQFGKHCFRLARRLNLTGSLILASEGFNMALNGSENQLATFFYESQIFRFFLANDQREKDNGIEMMWKQCCAHSHFHIFQNLPQRTIKRLRLRVKEEIIRSDFSQQLRKNLSTIRDQDGSHLSPEEFRRKMIHDKDAIILDMRNDYEGAIGTFRNAHNFHLHKFSELFKKRRKLEEIKGKKLLTFCTGGIRCEKSKVLLENFGFSNVYQLDGGIFHYLRKFPQADGWEGDCFVFDDRVSIDFQMRVGNFIRCNACGQALNAKTRECSYHACGKQNVPKNLTKQD